MQSTTLSAATKIHRERCDWRDLARYYIKSELPRIMGHVLQKEIDKTVDGLDDMYLLRMLHALSDTFRINHVADGITDEGLDWYEVDLPVAHIKLTGIRPPINKLMYSDSVQRDPLRFAEYLQNYYAKHPDPANDPEDLNELRPDGRTITHATLFTMETPDGDIGMLDGSHRLIALVMQGKRHVRVFSAVPNGKPHRSVVAEATFKRLAKLYMSHSDPTEREQILATTALLARDSANGRQAIQNYWIRHTVFEEMRQAGETLLKRLDKKSK